MKNSAVLILLIIFLTSFFTTLAFSQTNERYIVREFNGCMWYRTTDHWRWRKVDPSCRTNFHRSENDRRQSSPVLDVNPDPRPSPPTTDIGEPAYEEGPPNNECDY